nr:hypothetical protein [uncultured Pseudodesulfovibrio sp.]
MLPHTHAAFALVLTRLFGIQLSVVGFIAVILLANLADLVDKPLYWIGCFSSGKNLFHSGIFLMVVTLLTAVFKNSRMKTCFFVLWLCVLSHVTGDLVLGFVMSSFDIIPNQYHNWFMFPLFPFVDPIQPPLAMDIQNLWGWIADTLFFVLFLFAYRKLKDDKVYVKLGGYTFD